MRLYRIGDKVVSLDKLVGELAAVLEDRQRGATQLEVSLSRGVERSFVSRMESIGEVRRGPKVALVAFPVANADEVRALADEHALDLVMVFSQSEREAIEGGDASEVFNRTLDTLAELKDFDVVVLLASDRRIRTVEKVLGRDTIAIPLGTSPLRQDVSVDIEELSAVLDAVTAPGARPKADSSAGEAAAEMLRRAAGAARAGARGWAASRRS